MNMSQDEEEFEDRETSLFPILVLAGLIGLSVGGSIALALTTNLMYYAVIPLIIPVVLVIFYFAVLNDRN